MKEYIKNNINKIICIFLFIQPILDLITGLSVRLLDFNLTIGIIIRIIFLIFIMFTSLFIYKKKDLLVPYIIIFIYSIFYIIGIFIYKDSGFIFRELQGLVKVMYYPIILISLYSIKDEFNIDKKNLLIVLITYLILIFIPTIFNIGFNSYEITRVGTLGFFNSANEISGIISIITPFLICYLFSEKSIIKRIIFGLIYLIVILMMGTKTPLFALGIVLGMTIIYLWIKWIKKKDIKKLLISLITVILIVLVGIIAIPKTNVYENIETEMDFIDADNIVDILEDEEMVDHAIFGQRLTFLKDRGYTYSKANTYQRWFGIGYVEDKKDAKLIEIDYFDIMINHGLVGFMIVIFITVYVLMELRKEHKKIDFENYMNITSIILIFLLAGFTGHILTAPAVSFIGCLVILKLFKKEEIKEEKKTKKKNNKKIKNTK